MLAFVFVITKHNQLTLLTAP